MFRCTDCGQEFEIKPDYCDCGNDKFEEVVEKPDIPGTKPVLNTAQNVELPKINSQFTQKSTTNHKENHSNLNLDIPSVLIFLSCIILSILAIIYIGKDSLEQMEKDKNKPQNQNATLVKNNNIPSINKLWNDTPAVLHQEKQQSTVNTQQTNINNIAKTAYTPKISTNKVTSDVIKKNQIKTKKLSTVNPTKTVQKKVQTSNTKTKQIATPASKPAAVKTTPKTTSQSNNTIVKQQPVNTVQLQQEMRNYKIALRNKLANSISFGQIVGDGFCSVSFKVDTAGNLINRRFAVQSDNDSLNNTVYSAIMNNPTYQSPPQGYKNETLTFSVKMYGGRFSVTLN